MKNIKKLLLTLLIFGLGYSILDALFTDGIKNTYCLSDDKCVTVWKRGNGEAYIIFGKYKGQKIPTDNYLKTDYKNAVTIIVDDSSNYDYIVFNNYGREVSVKSSNFKIKYYAYEQEDLFIKSYYSNNYRLLINQDILDLCKIYNVNLFQITLDGHRDRHNEVRYISKNKGSYDEIVNNIKLCLKNNFFVSIRINISEETVKDLLKIIDDFKDISENEKQYMSFSFHEVWQEEKNLTVDISEIVDVYRGYGFICSYKGERAASIKNSCYADKLNQAVINYNGDVFKCTARDFNSESKEGILSSEGTITWNDNFQKRIYDLRFKNKPCLECKILPICNGGCSQHKLEHEGKDYCIFNYDDSAKLEIIKQKFYSRLHKVTA